MKLVEVSVHLPLLHVFFAEKREGVCVCVCVCVFADEIEVEGVVVALVEVIQEGCKAGRGEEGKNLTLLMCHNIASHGHPTYMMTITEFWMICLKV